MSYVRVNLFGSPEIKVGDGAVHIGSRRAMALFAYLTQAEQAVSRDLLANLFWSDVEQSRARGYLRHTLWQLRQAVGSETISTSGDLVRIEPDTQVISDVSEFDAYLARFRGHGHTELGACSRCRPWLTEAVLLANQDFMAGFSLADSPVFDEWQYYERERLRADAVHALQGLARYHLAEGEWRLAISFVRRWLALDDLDEDAHRLLMEILARSGQRAAAIRQYDECARRLRELAVSPSAATDALLDAIRNDALSALSQDGYARSDAAFTGAAPAISTPVSSSIPAIPTSFVGRCQEIAAIHHLLDEPAVRLITVTGPPGVGKTRLAVEATALLTRSYSDGVVYIPLASVRDSALVGDAMERVFKLDRSSGKPVDEAVVEFLRAKELLLLLDNFEHLLVQAELLSHLLANCPRLTLLVTSRERLNLYGEHALNLEPLQVPDRHRIDGIAALRSIDSVALFVQRARSVFIDFTLRAENVTMIVDICRRLDGIPLALELAAARLRFHSLNDLTKSLDLPHTLLETNLGGGFRDAPERHRSLYGAIDWSYRLLTSDERTVLRRLSVFVGGCDLAAAEFVCTIGDALSEDMLVYLTSLADKSLLRMMHVDGGQVRISLLESIREFGIEQLKLEGEGHTAAQAHCQYYADWLVKVGGETEEGGLAAFAQYEAGNVLGAIEFALATVDTDSAMKLGSVWNWWMFTGQPANGLKYMKSILALPDVENSPSEHGQILVGMGNLAEYVSDFDAAFEYLTRSIDLAKEHGDVRLQILALDYLSLTLRSQGKLEEALPLLEDALRLAEEVDDALLIAACQRELGKLLSWLGQPARSRVLLEASLTVAKQIKDSCLIADALYYLCRLDRDSGDFESAYERFQRCLQLYRDGRNDQMVAYTETELARLACDMKEYRDAVPYLCRSMDIFIDTGHQWGIGYVLEVWALVLAAVHEHATSLRLAAAASALRKRSDSMASPDMHALLESSIEISRMYLGDHDSERHWKQGTQLSPTEAKSEALSSPALAVESWPPDRDRHG